jgi:putative SOS response-associated peptidase YedK
MCTSYESPSAARFEAFSLFSAPTFDYPREVYKDYQAPIVRRSESTYTTDPATFGIVPRAHIPENVKVFDTMNCRVETAGSKRSFRPAWTRLQLCLIGTKRFYEPNYETGKAVRWRIGLASGEPLAIAGLWRAWKEPDGNERLSFSMLTVNAEEHPLMNRFHRPGSEKRSVVIVPAAEHEAWLASRTTDEAMSFLRLFPADQMHAEPCPLPPRAAKAGARAAKGKSGSDAAATDPQASLLADG